MPSLDDFDLFVFDFDGVLTDNMVLIDATGVELVRCCRSDGLAFDGLRCLGKSVLILSTEVNSVVEARARKLQVPVVYGVKDKAAALRHYCSEASFSLDRTFYTGNDINDLDVMKIVGMTACPADSHGAVADAATYKLSVNGGSGVVREIIEAIFGLDLYHLMYSKE